MLGVSPRDTQCFGIMVSEGWCRKALCGEEMRPHKAQMSAFAVLKVYAEQE